MGREESNLTNKQNGNNNKQQVNNNKTCLKWPLKKKTKNGFQGRLSLNAGQYNTFDLY